MASLDLLITNLTFVFGGEVTVEVYMGKILGVNLSNLVLST